MISVILCATAVTGAGQAGLDYVIGFRLSAVAGLAACVGIGVGGAALLLLSCWRPGRAGGPAGDAGTARNADETTPAAAP